MKSRQEYKYRFAGQDPEFKMGGPRQRSTTAKTRKEFREMQHQQQQHQQEQQKAQHRPREGEPYL